MVLLASAVSPLVGEVDPGACAGLLLGETAACPPVSGSRSCLSVGRAVSRMCSEANVGSGRPLGSLSVPELGCAPALVVVLGRPSAGACRLLGRPGLRESSRP